LAFKLDYLEKGQYDQLADMVGNTMRILQGLIKAVKKEAGLLGRIQATILAGLFLTVGKYVSQYI